MSPRTSEIRPPKQQDKAKATRTGCELLRDGAGADQEAPVVPTPLWKRCLDLSLIVLSLPVTVPLVAAIVLWIKMTSGGTLLFRQERIGYNGARFMIYKFRSMRENAETGPHEDHVVELVTSDRPMTKLDLIGDERLIPGGACLRNTGLDELPQLINVLRGEMSLVGPRPCLPKEYEHYTKEQRERFAVVPGLTGYWQVNGKNRTTFTEMVALDVQYARNRSLWLDLKIILKTPLALFLQIIDGKARATNEDSSRLNTTKQLLSPRTSQNNKNAQPE